MTLEEFKINIGKRRKQPRKAKITNSYGVKDGYKYYKNKMVENNEQPLPLQTYLKVLRTINNILRDSFINGKIDIVLPAHLGSLELRRVPIKKKIVDGKVVTNAYIDWNKTLELWYEDEEAFNDRTLVKSTRDNKLSIYYNKDKAHYIFKSYFDFQINRQLREAVMKNHREGKIDCYLIS